MKWIKLTDAKNGMPIYVNLDNVALVTKDLGGTVIAFMGGMMKVEEAPDDILANELPLVLTKKEG